MHRTCYLILAVTITCLFQAGVAWADTNDSDRPNILWIVAEDLSPWMGCYGDATNKDHTPVIDQLAAKGVLFKRTYMPAPVCSSCRSALITGVMQTTTGTQHHRSSRFTDGEIVPQELRIELPKEVVTIPERLRKAGYFTFNSGKDDYNFHYNRQELYSVGSANEYQPGKNGWQGNRSRVNGSITKDTWNARPDKKQPWFGQIQIKGGKGSDRLVDKSDLLPIESLTPPPYFPDTKVYRTAWTKHYNSVRGTDINVGKIIDQLRADGELDNTIVFFFSDHGNNQSPRHKQFCYEGGVHVPLIIHGNHASIANGTVREDLVSGLDISATTLRLAGVELPEVIDGRDLLASSFSPRDHVISARDRCDYTIDRIRTVRTDRFRYIRNGFPDRSLMQAQYRDNRPIMTEMKRLKDAGELSEYQLKHWFGQRPTEELYDIESDPHQMNSLADDPAFRETLTQHRKMLDDWIAKTGDQGQKPESQAQLKATYDLWKDRKVFSDADVNPEYDAFKNESLQPAQKDLGQLIFEDSFDRDESQEEKDEVGNGWTTNADKPWSKGKKQTDLRDGVLHVVPANGKRSDLLVIRPADLHDSTIQFRFRLPHDDDQIGLVIADSTLKDVHAGHVMNVWMSKGEVKVSDMMNGFFEPEIYKRRKAGELTKEDNAVIAAMGKTFTAPIKTEEWHQVTITTKKDQLTISIDDDVVGQFVAPAFAHHKNVLRVSFRRFGAIDDFKIYDAKVNTGVNKSEASPIEFVDTFVSTELKGREFVAPRGEWTFESGIASATSTVELLKKNTIHGPNIKWHVEFTDGSIEFEMKPEDCQRVTFTLNGGGHIFRWVSTARQPGSVYDDKTGEKYRHSLIAWATKSSKQNEGEFIDAKPIKHLSELQDRWTKVRLNINGDSGTFQVGDDVHRLSHAAFKRLKTNIVLSFGYGKLSIRNFRYSVQK